MNHRSYEKKKKRLEYCLSKRISRGMRRSLKGNKNGRHWEDLVGYTLKDLREYLKRSFTKGMTWKKFMSGEIHIDHIIPVSQFSFKSFEDEQFRQCWSLTNLRPLGAKDNISKHNKIVGW